MRAARIDIGEKILVDIGVVLHEGLECSANRKDISRDLPDIDVALNEGLEALPPDINVGVILAAIDVALHDGLECVATRYDMK